MGRIKQSFLSTLLPAVLILTLGVWLLAKLGLAGANVGSLVIGFTATAVLIPFYKNAGKEDQSEKEPTPQVEQVN